MKSQINLQNEQITFPADKVIIVKYVAGLPGGRTLDVTDWAESVISCGTPVKVNASGDCSPIMWDATASKYKDLAAGESYVGVMANTVSKNKPVSAIMTMGTINPEALPHPLPTAFKTAFPAIVESKDVIA